MKFTADITENVSAMLQRVPDLTNAYVKQEMVRFGNRFRRRMRLERMHGRPGIDAPKLSKGKNLSAWTKGNDIRNITTTARITRILVVHERGATITAKAGKYLYIGLRGKNTKTIMARVPQVTIPARLGFRSLWDQVVPEERQRIKDTMNRALKVAGERNVKQMVKII